MIQYFSGRKRTSSIGIPDYTENDIVLDIIGKGYITNNLGIGDTNPQFTLSFGESSLGIQEPNISLSLYNNSQGDNFGVGINSYFDLLNNKQFYYLDLISKSVDGNLRVFTGLNTETNLPYQRLGINSEGSISINTNEVLGKVTLSGKLGFVNNVLIGDENTGLNLIDNDVVNDESFGLYNVIVGPGAGSSNTFGSNNVFIGKESGYLNTEGFSNIFIGNETGYSNTLGSHNLFLGNESGSTNTEGEENIFLGNESGSSNTLGSYNIFLGKLSGLNNESGNYNILLGNNVGVSSTTSNRIILGQGNTYQINQVIQVPGFVSEITLNSVGSGYTFGDVGITSVTFNNTGTGGTGASAFAFVDVDSGEIGEIFITDGGENYLSAPTVTIDPPIGGGVAAGATVGITTQLNETVTVIEPFDSPYPNKNNQLAIGIHTNDANQYWIFGDDNFNVGIGSTQPQSRLSVSGDVTADAYYGDLVFGTPDGGFQSGAVAITTDSFTNNVVDDINFILGKLVPKPPTTINNVTLTLTGLTGTGLLCTGFSPTNNTTVGDLTPTAGTSYSRNTSNVVTSSYITEYGPGDSGTVTAYINAVGVGTTTLTTGSNNGTYGALQIANDKDAFFSTRNTGIASQFYEVYDARILNASCPDGFNKAFIQQDLSKTTNAFWYEDPSTVSAPVLAFGSVTSPSSGIVTYSSGIPHYSNNVLNVFSYVMTLTNGSGDMYTQNQVVGGGSATTWFTGGGTKNYTDFAGGTNPPGRNFGVGTGVTTLITHTPNDIHDTVTSNHFSQFSATTPYGSQALTRVSYSTNVNIMGTTSTVAKIDEDNISVTISGTGGNAVRVGAVSSSNNPVPTPITSWNATNSIATYEAAVRGGVLRHDQTNYTTYLPAGPNYSVGRSGDQYFQVQINRSSVSGFNIVVNGTYNNCWVSLPNNTVWTGGLVSTNGWANMFLPYFGSGTPSDSTSTGCAIGSVMSGSTGTFKCTLGEESSSSNSGGGIILVRFKLTSGQSITSLVFAELT